MAAFVAREVGEELVDAEAVVEVAAAGDPVEAGETVDAPRWGLAAGCGDDEGSGVGEGVVVWVAPAVHAQGRNRSNRPRWVSSVRRRCA